MTKTGIGSHSFLQSKSSDSKSWM